MSALVLDAGPLLALERDDRSVRALFEAAHRHGTRLRTTAIVVAQVWRDPRGRQARLARFLNAVRVVAVDEELGRAAGSLLGLAGTNDPIDATVVLVAQDGDRILTSDPLDIERLAKAAQKRVVIVAC